MTIQEAIRTRHTVRRYTDRKIPEETVLRLTARIREHNERFHLRMRLVTENTDAFGPVLRMFLAKGVRNYVILASTNTNSNSANERLGYCGADIMILAQTLGLNSWWVGGTFSRKGVRRQAEDGDAVAGVLALGYGATQGVPHKSKRPEDISRYDGTPPEWFSRGVESVLLAPTALNKQAFTICGSGGTVSMTCENGIFSGVDLGIGKYHFEAGAGTENFTWA